MKKGESKSGGQGFQSSQRGAKTINPTEQGGKPLASRSCGSYGHLVAKCPDSWENLSKVNITEEEEHAVSAMKKAGVKMDLENDTAIIMGKEVSLNLTSSGHYCIPIDKTETLKVEEVTAVRLDELSFAHPPKKRLVALLKDAGIWKEEYDEDLSEIQSKCDLCKMYAVTPPRPVVSMPMAKQFNEKVTIDLKQYKDRWILHMIDMWSRYTVSVFINRKKPTNVIEALMKNWVGIFGVMGALMSDNGGEFSSDEMREVASILNVKVCTTAGMSPYQNGLCERVHAITDIMLMKLEAENKNVESGTLLSWANMARNSLQMWNGFSSHQLVLGELTEQENIALRNIEIYFGKKLTEPNIARKKSIAIIAETMTSKQEDLSHENGIEEQINDTAVHTTEKVDQTDIDIAKQLELEKLKQFNTYEEVEDGGQKTISTRWVITNKNGDTRARLVARGFEEQSFIPKDIPKIKWSIKTTDIKSAFLQGNKLERDVHIKPPVESDTPKGFIWKLKHGLYGLKDGARQFYISVKDELLNLGCRQSKLDPAMFILTVKGSVQGIFCCHVDSFLHAGNEEFEKLMEKLRKRFIAGKIEEVDFRYIGFMIKQNNEGIQPDHSIYMEKLDHQHIEPQRAFQKFKQLTQKEQTDYRRMVGQLNWAVQGSRPDLAFDLVDLRT
ncbi:unnamed protein product [Mytilus edulis]|uniref:Integrase catalytic domain-containing protein n=1 Tax=Mytilus edulis TaxID=6550 RepID=A0A8S3RII0_MYTED|nr:unnamed protein product [Mytilus edulis]